jgi:hypothetical protein
MALSREFADKSLQAAISAIELYNIDEVFCSPVIGVILDGKLINKASGLSDVVTTLRRFKLLSHA